MKSVLPALAILSAGVLSGCVVVDSQAHIAREEKRFTVSGTPDLSLTTFDGAIEVRAGADSKNITVEIEKRGPTKEGLDQLRVETRQEGNRIEIEVKQPSRELVFLGMGTSPSVKLVVTAPRESNVTAKGSDGSIRIEDIHGRLDLRTGDGSIRGRDIGGRMTMSTDDGSVTLDSTVGDLDVETGDGSVSVSGKLGVMKLRTGDGSVTVRADEGTVLKDDWSVTTGDGSVSLYLPADFGAELDARASDGAVRNELPLAAEADGTMSRSRHELRTKLGAGGKALRIRTGDGSIRLKSS